MRKNPERTRRMMVVIAFVAALWLADQAGIDVRSVFPSGGRDSSPIPYADAVPVPSLPQQDTGSAARRIRRAFAARESGFMVTVDARVQRILPDDLDGSRHQRFLIALEDGPTLLVAHNIDLAERASVREGDAVRIRGQYEWNDRGGVLHWTHRDPDGRHPGGWIESRGTRVE